MAVRGDEKFTFTLRWNSRNNGVAAGKNASCDLCHCQLSFLAADLLTITAAIAIEQIQPVIAALLQRGEVPARKRNRRPIGSHSDLTWQAVTQCVPIIFRQRQSLF